MGPRWLVGCGAILFFSSRALAGSAPAAAPAAKEPLVDPDAPPAPRPFWAHAFGSTGETIFEHTRASLRDPHFGMRVFCDTAVPGTLHDIPNPTAAGADALAGAPDHNHLFWDVAFGERLPVFTYFNVNPKRSRYARGIQVNLEAAAFMLLDFSSQSWGVIDTDYRLGASFDIRPWWDGWEHLSLSIGGYHESTHLGDEYVLSAATIQADAPPAANALLPYRANPSYEALPITLSFDHPFDDSHFSVRAYGGATAYFWSELPNGTFPSGSFPSEWRVGAELRWTAQGGDQDASEASDGTWFDRLTTKLKQHSTGAHAEEVTKVPANKSRQRRGAFGVEAAYELLAKRQYHHVGPEPGPATFVAGSGFWTIQHAMLIGLYNLDTDRSSSNAVGFSLDWIRGRSPFGQLTEYTHVDTIAGGFEYYW